MRNKQRQVWFIVSLFVLVMAFCVVYFDESKVMAQEVINEEHSETETQIQVLVSKEKAEQEIIESEIENKFCEAVNQYKDWQWTELPHEKGNEGWYSVLFAADIEAAANQRGHQQNSHSDYDFYSLETLEMLYKAQDRRANLELAHRYMSNNYQDESSLQAGILNKEKYCYQAVVDGYSAMTSCMAGVFANKHSFLKKNKLKDAQLYQLKLEALAWSEIAKSSEDPWTQLFTSLATPGIRGSEEDKELIADKVLEIKQKISVKRAKHGIVLEEKKTYPKLWLNYFDSKFKNYYKTNKQMMEAIGGCF